MERSGRVSLRSLRGRNFRRALAAARGPVVVLFGSPSCPGCRKLLRSLRQLSYQLSDRIDVHMVNAVREGGLARRLGISVLPTVVLFHEGREVTRFTGYRSRAALEGQVMPLLALLEDRATVPRGPSVGSADVAAIRRLLEGSGAWERLLRAISIREGSR